MFNFYRIFPCHLIWNGMWWEYFGLVSRKLIFFYCWFSRLRTFYSGKTQFERTKICRCKTKFVPFLLGWSGSCNDTFSQNAGVFKPWYWSPPYKIFLNLVKVCPLLLGLEDGHFWAKLHLCSTERQETARSSVFHNESVQGGKNLRENSFLTHEYSEKVFKTPFFWNFSKYGRILDFTGSGLPDHRFSFVKKLFFLSFYPHWTDSLCQNRRSSSFLAFCRTKVQLGPKMAIFEPQKGGLVKPWPNSKKICMVSIGTNTKVLRPRRVFSKSRSTQMPTVGSNFVFFVNWLFG
jgi:hypothetical protein